MTYEILYKKEETKILNPQTPNPHSAIYMAIFEISKIAKWPSAVIRTEYQPKDSPIKLPKPRFFTFSVILGSSHHIPRPYSLHL